jgi:alkylation response protein AidB-like acyl-CoA dehydrogenase
VRSVQPRAEAHPGIEVRRIKQVSGVSNFNEVFFTDARVPDELRLGGIDEGWTVALATLLNERASLAEASHRSPIDRLLLLAEHLDATQNPLVRQQLADTYMHIRVAELTSKRAMAKVKQGELPGPEMSIGKLALTNNLARVSAVASRLLGPKLTADSGEWGTYTWSEFVLTAPGLRLGGGTDEIQKNIIGEHVLSLPRELKTST